MTDKLLERIEDKLDLVIRLLAGVCVEGKTTKEAILALGRLGLDRTLIAAVCDTTPGTVSVRLSEAKGHKKKAKPRKKAAARQVDEDE